MSPGKTYFIMLFSLSVFLFGCASSDVSRHAADNIDSAVGGGSQLTDNISNSDAADAYQNSSQSAKGAIIGGGTGAVTGLFSSGIGVIPGLATGMVLGASYGAYIDANTDLKDKLENRGANIIVLGDQILIVLPSSRLFHYMTPDMKTQSYSTLELVAKYINTYTKMLVKVAAYTDAAGPKQVKLALSQQQAETVSKVLNASGVDARVLYAVGYGGTNLVEKTVPDWTGTDSDNDRIEITLEKQYV